ncbi:hypothetical protein [Thalassospira xiamenensis]|uniref:Uncharacterized protein n=1 Tax=Thalassospira xiamenensis TaxID=220697 RepID=A0A285RKD9_9PROT|nr:hypothetical protein [Thalassospira xiamenensis]SOB94570.1 hypothetical protein SAMN05428964_1011114 [Thalassospira xiamenensis]
MKLLKTNIIREDRDVEKRLAELGLSRKTLLEIRDVAIGAAANATPNHAANAAGTYAYQDGVFALRDRHVGDSWQRSRQNGVELIFNETLGIKLGFCNVDQACRDVGPKPRSVKGSGAERVCTGNLFGSEDNLPHYSPPQRDGSTVYYLMVAQDGAVELTSPVIRAGTFKSYVERIFLSEGTDIDGDFSIDDDDRIEEFDPIVSRK